MNPMSNQRCQQEMLETIRSEARLTAAYTGRAEFSAQVMQAM